MSWNTQPRTFVCIHYVHRLLPRPGQFCFSNEIFNGTPRIFLFFYFFRSNLFLEFSINFVARFPACPITIRLLLLLVREGIETSIYTVNFTLRMFKPGNGQREMVFPEKLFTYLFICYSFSTAAQHGK